MELISKMSQVINSVNAQSIATIMIHSLVLNLCNAHNQVRV